jgi:hypothetical protein
MLDRIGGMRNQAIKGTVGKLIAGKTGDVLCGLMAGKEVDLLEQIAGLHEALDIDDGIGHEDVPRKEDRREQLKELVQALVADDIPGFWWEQVGREHVENPEDAREFLDLDGGEWAEQVDSVIRSYRRQGDDRPRSEIVADYVNRKFGVEVSWFVSHVVNWTDAQSQRVQRQFLLGNMDAVQQGIERATEEV